ncbi:MAG TPA: recombinase RecT [Bryobacteraceae bacterium]|jgi:hypothetical protein|nr:recombinase RecT [Bryobacteraceae bacterium]
MNTPTVTDETMPKKEFQQVQLAAVEHVGGMKLAFNNFAELEKFSHFMALSNFVPKHLRQKQADCLAVLLQSMRWEMDPFSVAQKTYFVNDGMAYEAQLVNAIILSRAPLKARPKLEWSGEGENLKCKVSATFVGEDEPAVFEAELKPIITRNSPLWKQQPKQQLGYFATRAWARLYCPDILMGVYTKEEMEDRSFGIGPDNAVDVTNSSAASALDDINNQIRASKPQPKAAPNETFDAETGEVIDQAAGDTSPPEVKPTDPKPAPLPTFDISKHTITTAAGVKAAAAELIAVLTAYPAEERPAVFLGSSGVMVVEAMREKGMALEVTKIEALGISLPAPEEQKPSGKKLFSGSKDGAAA